MTGQAAGRPAAEPKGRAPRKRTAAGRPARAVPVTEERDAPPARTGRGAGSAAQQDRRKRILRATLTLASKGGYEAVQMRDVADRADVALGTLYRYFPSKVHLLVSALAEQIERTHQRTKRMPLPGDTPFDRLMFILDRMTSALQRDPQLTEAMTRAFMFADASVRNEVDAVGATMDAMLARAFDENEPTEEHLALARVISDVWLANLIAWITYRASAEQVARRLELTISLLLGEPDHHHVKV